MPKTTTSVVRMKSKRPARDIRRIVMHTTEGILNAEDLPPFFRRVQADSHLGIDKAGDAVRMVPDDEKAWTQAAYNPGSLSIEQCGFASWSTKTWVKDFHKGLLRGAAACSNWSQKYPWIKLRRSVANGICAHNDLGAAGGGHWDPGPNFPWRYFIYLARLHYYRDKGWSKRPRRRRLRAAYYKRYCHAVQRRYAGRVLGTTL